MHEMCGADGAMALERFELQKALRAKVYEALCLRRRHSTVQRQSELVAKVLEENV